MNVSFLKETIQGEFRSSCIPLYVEKLKDLGAEVRIESGIGLGIALDDRKYRDAGAQVIADRQALIREADLLIRINKPDPEEICLLKKNSIHISHLDPYNEKELVSDIAENNITALSVEMIPRTTRAQKMDVLSSQANIAGYVMVIVAAAKLKKILPMMMTPAGTIAPARVFIIGAGVAGLQAIATAKRMGARVDAFDTREVVEEQVQSLGGKFVKIDLGETGQTKDGYAKALTPEQLEIQRKGLAKVCANSDIVITTAQIPGKKAPRIVTREMIEGMQPGSVIVDMAAASGGNVEGSLVDEEAIINGVSILGFSNLPSHASFHASQMYSANMFNIIDEYWDKEKKEFVITLEDDILAGCVITHDGTVCNKRIADHYAK